LQENRAEGKKQELGTGIGKEEKRLPLGAATKEMDRII
jgi:hypothetical protein